MAREMLTIGDNNTGTFLAPVLQGIETKIDHQLPPLVTENPEDTTFLFEHLLSDLRAACTSVIPRDPFCEGGRDVTQMTLSSIGVW